MKAAIELQFDQSKNANPILNSSGANDDNWDRDSHAPVEVSNSAHELHKGDTHFSIVIIKWREIVEKRINEELIRGEISKHKAQRRLTSHRSPNPEACTAPCACRPPNTEAAASAHACHPQTLQTIL